MNSEKNHPHKKNSGSVSEDVKKVGAEKNVTPSSETAVPPAAPQEDQTVTVSLKEYEDLRKKVQELEGLREKLLHAAADFENAKKRNAREKEEFLRFSQERILKEILPVLDNFDRATGHATVMSATENSEEALQQGFKTFVSGIQRVQKQLMDILKAHGLTRFETLGKPYDPHFHEVVAHVAEEGAEDQIVDELEPGYMFHDRLLRAAKVRVRVSPQANSTANEKQDEIT